MTYRELRDALNQLSEEELDLTATIANGPVDSSLTEFFPVASFDSTGEEDDVLDAYHPVLVGDF